MMARKGVILQALIVFGSYINLFILMFGIRYIQDCYATKIEELIDYANNIGIAIGVYISLFYSITIIYWTYSYFQTFKKANSLERQNITLKDAVNIKKFEGVGILNKKIVKLSKLNVAECFRDRELKILFEKIIKRIKVNYTKDVQEYTEVGMKEKDVIKYELEFDEIDFSAYTLDYLIYKEMKSFFDDDELKFLEEDCGLDIATTDVFEQLDMSMIEEFETKYIIKFKKKRDFKEIQQAVQDTLDLLSKEEISFLESKGIVNLAKLVEYDAEQLTKDYNAHFNKDKPAITKATNKFKEWIEKQKQKTQEDIVVDFKVVIEIITKKVIENEKHALYSISKDARFKYMYLKLVNMKALHYEYQAYLVEFDKPLEIAVGEEDYSIYSKYEHGTEALTRENADIGEQFAYVSKALVILPSYWEKSFDYQPDYLFDFEGHAVPCAKVTEVEYIFKSMLDSEHAVLYCNTCSYIRDHVKSSLDVDVNIIASIEKSALLELLHDVNARQEIMHKRIDQLQTRVEKNKQNYERMLNDWVEDINAGELVKKWVFKKKPMNIYTQVVFVICVVVAFFVGMMLMYSIDTIRIQTYIEQYSRYTQMLLPLIEYIVHLEYFNGYIKMLMRL